MGTGTACLPLGTYIGIRARKRSNLCAGPPCECLLGENPQRLFRCVLLSLAFWSQGGYCGTLGSCVDVTDKLEPLKRWLWALCKQ